MDQEIAKERIRQLDNAEKQLLKWRTQRILKMQRDMEKVSTNEDETIGDIERRMKSK